MGPKRRPVFKEGVVDRGTLGSQLWLETRSSSGSLESLAKAAVEQNPG